MMEINELELFGMGFVDPVAVLGKSSRLYQWQRDYLRRDHDEYCIILKSRQIGASFILALEAVAKAMLWGESTLFQSISLRESKNKINYAREIVRALPTENVLVRDTVEELQFRNMARIVSLPGSPNASRGFAGYNVVLDELAFIGDADEVIGSVLPVMTHGGTLTIASTPLDAEGAFHEKWSGAASGAGWTRFYQPWWTCEGLTVSKCIFDANPGIAASSLAIREIRSSLVHSQFEREYCCQFSDEGTAIFRLKHLDAITDPHMQYQECEQRWDIDETWPGQQFIFAMDIGVVGHPSVLVLLDVSKRPSEVRAVLTLRGIDHMAQVSMINNLAAKYRPIGIIVDSTGPGAAIKQELVKKHPMIADGIDFTLQSKERLVRQGIQAVQNKDIKIPADRLWRSQMHSLTEDVTSAGNIRYITPADKMGHSDRLWALLMAIDVRNRLAY